MSCCYRAGGAPNSSGTASTTSATPMELKISTSSFGRIRDSHRTFSTLSRSEVLLPCWRRPEFLWHCIDNLSHADGIENIHVIFRPDTGYAPDILDVIRSQGQRLATSEIKYPPVCPFRRTKQSANVLLGYLHAARKTRQFVFLIEEDIMVTRDFFRWHRDVHAQQPELFCSIAAKNHNRDVTPPPNVDGYY